MLFRMIFEINTLLNANPGMTIDELSDAWMEHEHTDEIPITPRIFRSDKRIIACMFGISIEPCKFDHTNVFCITNPEVIQNNKNLAFALNAAKMLALQELFSLDGTRLDIHPLIDDIDKVMFFGECLMKNCVTKIRYQKFDESPVREVSLQPYWLKDYEDRMYIVGHLTSVHDRKKLRTFALDRILSYNIVHTARRFHVPVGMDPISYYTHVCGIVVPNHAKPQKVRIRAYEDEPSYLLTKPIHHSQTLSGPWDKSCQFADFDLFIIPTLEFKKKIIERAGRIEVLSPNSLRAEILETLEKTASRFRGAFFLPVP